MELWSGDSTCLFAKRRPATRRSLASHRLAKTPLWNVEHKQQLLSLRSALARTPVPHRPGPAQRGCRWRRSRQIRPFANRHCENVLAERNLHSELCAGLLTPHTLRTEGLTRRGRPGGRGVWHGRETVPQRARGCRWRRPRQSRPFANRHCENVLAQRNLHSFVHAGNMCGTGVLASACRVEQAEKLERRSNVPFR